jgi:hypothetical protein
MTVAGGAGEGLEGRVYRRWLWMVVSVSGRRLRLFVLGAGAGVL